MQNWQQQASPLFPLSPRPSTAAPAAGPTPEELRSNLVQEGMHHEWRNAGTAASVARRIAACGPRTAYRMASSYASDADRRAAWDPAVHARAVAAGEAALLDLSMPAAGARTLRRRSDLMALNEGA